MDEASPQARSSIVGASPCGCPGGVGRGLTLCLWATARVNLLAVALVMPRRHPNLAIWQWVRFIVLQTERRMDRCVGTMPCACPRPGEALVLVLVRLRHLHQDEDKHKALSLRAVHLRCKTMNRTLWQ